MKDYSESKIYLKKIFRIFSRVFVLLILFGCGETSRVDPFTPPPSPVATLEGVIDSDLVLTPDASPYLLKGKVIIEKSLTILPGTVIQGIKVPAEDTSNIAVLVISQNATIKIAGECDKPIIFTSDQPDGQKKTGDWGGVVINGRAQTNIGKASGEGGTGDYGWPTTDFNNEKRGKSGESGIFEFVRIEFGGANYSSTKQYNGLSLQGVSCGLIVNHIHVHKCKDDGIEFFGGTVNASHILCTEIGDDAFDWVEGWTGYGQFWIGTSKEQPESDDDIYGIEGSNANDDTNNSNEEPISHPTIYNVTLVGESGSKEGIHLKRGTSGVIKNVVIDKFTGYIDNAIKTLDVNNPNFGKIVITPSSGEVNSIPCKQVNSTFDVYCMDVSPLEDPHEPTNPVFSLKEIPVLDYNGSPIIPDTLPTSTSACSEWSWKSANYPGGKGIDDSGWCWELMNQNGEGGWLRFPIN